MTDWFASMGAFNSYSEPDIFGKPIRITYQVKITCQKTMLLRIQ